MIAVFVMTEEEMMIRGIGTMVNVLAILLGGGIGLLVQGGLSKNLQDSLMKACGLSAMMIGISGVLQEMMEIQNDALSVSGTLLVVLSLVIGVFIGELLHIEEKLEQLGEFVKAKCKQKSDSRFSEGFVTVTLIFCVGAMAIVGSLEDGIMGDPSILFVKSMLDGVVALVFASTLGLGVLFSVFPLALYQGGITAFSVMIEPYLTDVLISQMSMVGSVLILGIGINLTFGKQIKIGNFLPALLIPVFYQLILKIF